jgi:peptidoglycan-N-acetylglucosamine deacetylase
VAEVTLTFDNGPDPEATPQVLDVLAARDLRATFFLIGRKLAAPNARPLAERARAEGHWIGNHTWSHATPLGRMPGPNVAADEVARTEREIGGLAGAPKLFRPYGGGGLLDRGLLKRSVVDHLVAERYSCVLWSAVPRDWSDPDGWVERALAQCAARAQGILVLHDIASGAMRHLGRFLDEAQAAGLRFRQDFPPDLVPIRDGVPAPGLEAYVSDLD